MRRGRVLARSGGELRVRCGRSEEVLQGAGSARPGDWVQWEQDCAPQIVASFAGDAFPLPSSETARLSLPRLVGLEIRAQVLAEVRRYFSEQGFLEIEAPILVPTPGLEVNIEAVEAGSGYLITSPEFSMKRLLAGGLQKIYAMPRCFRCEEEGAHHSTEFTMLEWYRSFEALPAIMRDTELVVHRAALAVRGVGEVSVAGRSVNVTPPWPRMTVREAFKRWAGVELAGDESAKELSEKLLAAGIDIGGAKEWGDLFYVAFVERVQPALDTLPHALLLLDWPAPLAALARRKPGAPEWALRFEAYVGGVELANAFDELTDPVEQRRRFEEERELRRRLGRTPYPIDEKFMAALDEGLPPCAGIALGIDRLAMLVAGADSLREVCAFGGEEL